MNKADVRQLDSQGEIYATIDERGSIIGTGSKEVCEFLVLLANRDFQPMTKGSSPHQTSRATIRSAIEI